MTMHTFLMFVSVCDVESITVSNAFVSFKFFLNRNWDGLRRRIFMVTLHYWRERERERASGRSHLTGFESQTLLPCMKVVLYEVRCLKSNEDMILALAGQFKLSHYIPFTGKHEPNKLTGSQLRDFVAQLARALHRHRRGHGFGSRWVTWIFQVHETIA